MHYKAPKYKTASMLSFFSLLTCSLLPTYILHTALRLQVVSWEEAEDASLAYLRMASMDSAECIAAWPPACRALLGRFWAAAPLTSPRFENLREVLLHKHSASATAFRGILFVEQRVSECSQ